MFGNLKFWNKKYIGKYSAKIIKLYKIITTVFPFLTTGRVLNPQPDFTSFLK